MYPSQNPSTWYHILFHRLNMIHPNIFFIASIPSILFMMVFDMFAFFIVGWFPPKFMVFHVFGVIYILYLRIHDQFSFGTLNMQHVFHILTHHLVWNGFMRQYPHGHVNVWVINVTLGVWTPNKILCNTHMASHDLLKCSFTTCFRCKTHVKLMDHLCDVFGCEIRRITLEVL